jgi:DNA-binding transcriptional ArsR family regulator
MLTSLVQRSRTARRTVQDRIIGPVADVTVSRVLKALKAAGNPVRLQILAHAAANRDHVRPSDAKPYMSSSSSASTAQYHFRALVDALLLERVGWGQYRLTDAGRYVSGLSRMLADEVDEDAAREAHDQVTPSAMSVRLLAEGALGEALRETDDLVAELTRTLVHGQVERSTLRVSRSTS